MRFTRRVAGLIMLLALLASSFPLFASASSPPLPPGTITLTSFADDATANNGTCSLREAVAAVNTQKKVDKCPAGTTIALAAGTYHLTVKAGTAGASSTGALQISGNVTISGAGAGQTTIDATGLGDRVFNVSAKGKLALNNLTIRGGNSSGDGGGIVNTGTLSLSGVVLTANHAGGNGGGILNSGGALNLSTTLLSQNSASGDGGGIAITGGTVTIAASAILANQAGGNGGGIFLTGKGAVTLTNSTIGANSAGANGGGLSSTAGDPKGTAKSAALTNVTVTDNSAQRGGGINSSGTTSLFNTIVAGNHAPSAADCSASGKSAIASLGHNLIQTTASCALTGSTNSNITGKDAQLGPLGNYGGATPSYRPLLGSPAVDAGSNTNCPATDQRGVKRPGTGTGKAACDIGAVELSTGLQISVDDNTSWPHALQITPGVAVSSDALDAPGQSRWYKFHVNPSQQVDVTLTNLPANYDLTLFKDINAAYLAATSVTDTTDLAQLGAEFAPDAFSPDAFSPDAYSPDAYSPDAFSPDAFSPDAFSPDAYTPDAYSPDAFSPDAFSPDAFSPDAFSPDAFSPDAFSPDAFSPDAFSSAQTRSIIGASAFNGTASEGIRVNTWDLSGDFYVRVRGRNGADVPGANFSVKATVTAVGCDTVNWGDVDSLPVPAPSFSKAGARTIILTDMARMSQEDSGGNSAALTASLNAFAALPSVNGVVVDVDQDVQAANTLADATSTCPYLKNVVANQIKQIVDDYRQESQGLQYVVIVGDDNVIPFFRYPDQALLGSETNFFPPVKDTSASQASLRLGYVLSQDRYGAALNLSAGNTTLPLPQLAVGRLVETMAEVSTMLTAYGTTANGVITPGSALVTGYDFLADDAHAVQSELAAGLGASGKVDSLISEAGVPPSQSWTAKDLTPLLLNQKHDLVFLAGHFSASSALAADFSTRILTSDLLASPVDLTNEIIFSVGCHSGYNTVNSANTIVTPEPDWAEAAAQKGITLIAGTGYQYGDTDFIKYSEQIYLNFAQQLHTGSGAVALGQALVNAKLQYLTQSPPSALSGTAEKAFLEATLFGLPMLSVNMPGARLQLQGSLTALANSAPQSFSTNPGATLGLSYQDVSLNPALTKHQLTLNNPDGSTTTVTYYSGPDGVVVSPLAPVLPFVSQSAAGPSGTIVRGVGFFGGHYTDLPGVSPLTSSVVTEQSSTHLPFHSSYLYPAQPWALNYLGLLGGFGPPLLQVTAAQYQSESATSTTGTLRLLDDMNFRLFFSGNTATYPSGGTYPASGDIPALAAPPAISQVVATQGADGSINFAAHAQGDPLAGIQQVWVTYTVVPASGGDGQWISLDLTQSTADSTLWQASLSPATLQQQLGTTNLSNFRFMAQAANGVGLVTLATNFGAYYQVGSGTPPNPSATTLTYTSAPTSGAYGTTATFSAKLSSSNAACVAGQTLFFGIGAQRVPATTNANGNASATLPLLGSPGDAQARVTFGGSDSCNLASDSSPFTITKQPSHLTLTTLEGGFPLVVTLKDDNDNPLRQRSVYVAFTGGEFNDGELVTTDQSGTATIDSFDLPEGSFTVTASFGQPVTLSDGSSLDLTDQLYQGSSATTTLGSGSTPPPSETFLAWGRNNEGELGNGSTTDSSLPTPVTTTNIPDVTAFAAGDTFTIALKSDGTVWAWGNNGNNYLGDGTVVSRTTPVQVQNLSNIVAISARRVHSLALKNDGTVWAWGENGGGQLGDGTTARPMTPVQVTGLPTNIVAIAAGGFFSMALDGSGNIWTWGANDVGQLGLGTSDTSAHSTPAQMPAPATGITFSQITAGYANGFAVDQNGNLWDWGANNNGTLGYGSTDTAAHPTPDVVSGLSHVTAVAAYYNHALAVSGGTVYSWGVNGGGQLGDGTTTDHYFPQPIPGLSNVISVAVGGYHSLALTANGDLFAWGSNSEDGRIGRGQTGVNELSPVNVLNPNAIGALTGVTQIAAGDRFSLALQGGTPPQVSLTPTFLEMNVDAPASGSPSSNPPSVTATLLDQSESPIADKNVLIVVRQTGADAPDIRTSVLPTNASGQVTLDISDLLPGTYEVQAFFGDARNSLDPNGPLDNPEALVDLADDTYFASQSAPLSLTMALTHTFSEQQAVVTPSEGSDTVTIPSTNGGIDDEGGETSNYMLRGDFTLQMDYDLTTWPSGSGVRVGISVSDLASSTGSVERDSYGDADFCSPADEYFVTNFDAGNIVCTSLASTGLALPNLSGKLRLTRASGMLYAYYWDAGTDQWVRFGQSLTAITGDVAFSFQAWNQTIGSGEQLVTVQISNFAATLGTGGSFVPIAAP
ncbi:MAG TPA: choice-of-anchor Q domain-containing protein [Thermomicrobiaceae bacterium]|nr:choice-of-anchor Q domain-containing protein [Thermomicrobiaceae bacterium]